MGIGEYRHRVALSQPAVPIPDAGGAFADVPYTPLDPAAWDCAIVPATARTLERIGAGAVVAQATHVLRGRYHPGMTTQTRITFGARILSVLYVANREERGIVSDVVCSELVS